MSRPAQLGLIALIIALVVAAGIYAAVKSRSTGGYRMGVRFRTAAGLAPGGLVFFNGVNIGNVRRVKILPDTTVEVILNIFHASDIPKNAQFSIQSTFTGSPTIYIAVPRQRVARTHPPTPVPASDLLPKRVLAVQEQPIGTTPLSIEDVMGEGKALGDRAQRILAAARPYGSRLIGHLQDARVNGAATSEELRTALPAAVGSLKATIAQAKANASSAQNVLRARDQTKLAAIAAAFERSARDMSGASSALASIKNDRQLHANEEAIAMQLRAIAPNMEGLSRDMEIISKNPQTKAELRDAGARFHDVMSRLKKLLP